MAGGKKTSESEGNAEATINEADAKGKEMANAGKEQAATEAKKKANNDKVKADAADTKKSTVVRSDGLTYNNKGRFFRDGADKGKEVGGVNDWIATKKA